MAGVRRTYAVDGNSCHDTADGNYIAQIHVADIGEHFYLGGEARFVRPPPIVQLP